MEKPLCKLCGVRHWSRDQCAAAGKLPDRIAFKSPLQVAVENAASASPPQPMSKPELEFAALLKSVGRPGFDRVAYQREYMRKRRATEKESKIT